MIAMSSGPYIGNAPQLGDAERVLVTEYFKHSGADLQLAYFKLDLPDPSELLKSVMWTHGVTTGLGHGDSALFGYVPDLRGRPGKVKSEMSGEMIKWLYDAGRALTLKTIELTGCRAPGSLHRKTFAGFYTTGVINRDNAMRYHHDSGNVEDSYTGVVFVNSGVKGGELLLPELGIALKPQTCWGVIYRGDEFVHGAAPMTRVACNTDPSQRGHRYSIVFHERKGFK